MKRFLTDYGFAILAAIVVILLIVMCTPVGNLIKNQILNVVDSFAQKTETRLVTQDAEIIVGLKQLDDAGKFEVSVDSNSATDEFSVEYRVKDQNGNWSNWKEIGELSTSSKEHTGEFTAEIDNGNRIQVRAYDEGRNINEFYESNIISYTGNASKGEDVEVGSVYTWVENGNTLHIASHALTTDYVKYEYPSGINLLEIKEENTTITSVVVDETVKPTSMAYWFENLRSVQTWTNLNKIDTSNVTNMRRMFYYASYNATKIDLDLSGWDTSNVGGVMQGTFQGFGYNASEFALNISNWDTSNVTSFRAMFDSAGHSATSVNLDLSGWNTSNVTNTRATFWEIGKSATVFSLNISGWDMSNVTEATSMFDSAGGSATSWEIRIPSVTGAKKNTTKKLYANEKSSYISVPSGKTFTGDDLEEDTGGTICVTEDTLVTLSNGDTKLIKNINKDDLLLTYNLETGLYEPKQIKKLFFHGINNYEVIKLNFSDESYVEIIGEHGFLNKTKQSVVQINKDNYELFIDDEFLKDDGSIASLVSVEFKQRKVGNYSIMTYDNINFITNGFVSWTGGYPIIFSLTDELIINVKEKQELVNKYGVFNYEDWKEYITKDDFDSLGYKYLSILYKQGLIDKEYIAKEAAKLYIDIK